MPSAIMDNREIRNLCFLLCSYCLKSIYIFYRGVIGFSLLICPLTIYMWPWFINLASVTNLDIYGILILQSKDEEYLQLLIEQEQQELEVRRKVIAEEEQREKTMKKKNKEALIDELVR